MTWFLCQKTSILGWECREFNDFRTGDNWCHQNIPNGTITMMLEIKMGFLLSKNIQEKIIKYQINQHFKVKINE